jgi:hypothetical protein
MKMRWVWGVEEVMLDGMRRGEMGDAECGDEG